MSYKVEIVKEKAPLIQLEASKRSIKDLFKDVLNEAKGFKYQILLKVVLKKSSKKKWNLFQFISIQ